MWALEPIPPEALDASAFRALERSMKRMALENRRPRRFQSETTAGGMATVSLAYLHQNEVDLVAEFTVEITEKRRRRGRSRSSNVIRSPPGSGGRAGEAVTLGGYVGVEAQSANT